MRQNLIENVKHTLDFAAVSTTIATLMSILPAIAALFSIVWTAIRIWETDTVRKLFNRPTLNKESE